jgi:hypothetical protein
MILSTVPFNYFHLFDEILYNRRFVATHIKMYDAQDCSDQRFASLRPNLLQLNIGKESH